MSDDPTIHMMYPVMYVHNMYSHMVNKITHGMSISWSFYMQSENGRVIMVKSQPNMVNLGVDDGEDLYDGMYSRELQLSFEQYLIAVQTKIVLFHIT